MEPATIAASVVTALVPLLKKGSESFMKEVGSSVFDYSKKLLDNLKVKWARKDTEKDMLCRFEEKPDIYREAVQDMLFETLKKDEDFAIELANVIKEIKQSGPKLEIVMDIETAEKKVTGLKSKHLKRGEVKTNQKIKLAKGPVKGQDIDEVG